MGDPWWSFFCLRDHMGSHHHPFSIPKASAALGTALIMESTQMIGAIVLARGRDPRCSIYLAVWLTTVSGKHMGTSHCFFWEVSWVWDFVHFVRWFIFTNQDLLVSQRTPHLGHFLASGHRSVVSSLVDAGGKLAGVWGPWGPGQVNSPISTDLDPKNCSRKKLYRNAMDFFLGKTMVFFCVLSIFLTHLSSLRGTGMEPPHRKRTWVASKKAKFQLAFGIFPGQ